jgi:hypothetical protein
MLARRQTADKDVLRERQDGLRNRKEFLVKIPNGRRRVKNLGCGHVRKNGNHPPRPKVAHEGIGPRRELVIEAATEYRSVDVDPERCSFLGAYSYSITLSRIAHSVSLNRGTPAACATPFDCE